jgi:hypothetical protein
MKVRVERAQQESVLARWRGASAQIWIFDVSLKRMAIRIYRPHEPELIYITAVGCKHITGPFSWEGADFSIEREPEGAEYPTSSRIIDKAAGFELRCSDAGVVRGPSTDFEKTFDNFLGDDLPGT